ncbi:hypothetical protein [Actinoplanes sp. DH11]|uniref:hypothetical protein n=1 Tax=Actinoplanes sp. DH11 TaxID=2857011 RepID=UPI001E3D9768|nr:hypothetical protein [Actinoplanes sp. DH11]
MRVVPFHPAPGRAERDPRFDAYRERAGRLSAHGGPFGLLYLRFDTYWHRLGGNLWWRRWSEPRELVTGYVAVSHGGFDDFVQDAATLADELEHWRRGLFPYRGEMLDVEWLDDAGSRRARDITFALDEGSGLD